MTKLKNMTTKRRTRKVSSTTVEPLAWNRAMKLAGGDAKRIDIISSTEVLVRRP